VAGYDLRRTWAKKVRIEPDMAELIFALRRLYPDLGERLPLASDEGFAYFGNGKARWFYANQPHKLRYEHESASEYVLVPAFGCLVHAVEDRSGRERVWYRWRNGEERLLVDGHELCRVRRLGGRRIVSFADGRVAVRDLDGCPLVGDQPSDLLPDGTREWRAALRRKPVGLPDLHPLHREGGPARILPDGTLEYWRKGKLHRDPAEGPAVVRPDGSHEYWRNGTRVTPPAATRTSRP
jgi:hypothetical protein